MASVTSTDAEPAGRHARGTPDRATVTAFAEIAAVMALWFWSLSRVDPGEMTDLGLVSVLPVTAFVALAALALSFGLALLRVPGTGARLLTAYPLALTLMLYLTPPLVYDTARYSWAWKHAGIVDYIDRTGGVDPFIDVLTVYHSWPGFFAFNAMLTDLAGLDSAMSYAAWAEVFFNLLTVAAVVALLRGLTDDPRTVAVAAWIFVLGNWVGQGYWSPQAISYAWYLLVVALLVHWFPGRPAAGVTHAVTTPARRAGLMGVVLLLLFCIVSTHQLTPVVTLLTVTVLVLTQRTNATTLPLLVTVLMGGWLLYVAAPFTETTLTEALAAIGAVDENVEGTLIQYDAISTGQLLVSMMSRAQTVAVVLLAGAGVIARLRRGHRGYTAFFLAAVPFTIVMFSPYGHEILFRAYLFALPGLAFFAAALLWPPRSVVTPHRMRVLLGVSLALMVGLLFSLFGNDRQYHFTEREVAAAEYVYDVAPPGTLLVEGSRNYPAQFENYDRFTYVPIAREAEEDRLEMVQHPVRVLRRWMGDSSYAASYLVITRSQKAETEALGEMPGGGLQSIEEALLKSRAFRAVLHNEDASVFVLRTQLVESGEPTATGGAR